MEPIRIQYGWMHIHKLKGLYETIHIKKIVDAATTLEGWMMQQAHKELDEQQTL